MPARIYVNRHALERNRQEGTGFPPICVRHPDGTTSHAHAVLIEGPARIVYKPEGLEDGTLVWVETDAPLQLERPETN